MPEVQHIIVAAILIGIFWIILRERNIKAEDRSNFHDCQRQYNLIKQEIEKAKKESQLMDCSINADNFYEQFHGRIPQGNLIAFFRDLNISITVKRNKLRDENSYA